MRNLATLFTLSLLLAGCTPLQKPGGILYGQAQERKLAAAVQKLEQGDVKGATELLEALSSEPAVPGITDEALFRLSLLYLKPALEKEGVQTTQQALERLRREFPASPWTRQAAPLTELLTATADLQRNNRNLKTLNISLTRENKELGRENRELRQNIEKLKHLDLELEQKSK